MIQIRPKISPKIFFPGLSLPSPDSRSDISEMVDKDIQNLETVFLKTIKDMYGREAASRLSYYDPLSTQTRNRLAAHPAISRNQANS